MAFRTSRCAGFFQSVWTLIVAITKYSYSVKVVLKKIVNFLSVDLEEYYHVYAFSNEISYRDWRDYPSRLEFTVEKTFSLLGEIKATFFVVGWVAEHFPKIIKAIHSSGHEIGCHTYYHEAIYHQSPKDFRVSLIRSKQLLEDLTGEAVIGFRAPTFSVTEKTLWVLDILMEEGFKYDSSIFPILHDRYGIPTAERFPFKIKKNGMELIELPISTLSFLGKNVPACGGGYTRILPYSFTRGSIKSLNKEGKPAVFYFHPWEIDPDQPRIKNSLLKQVRHYYNIEQNERKIGHLLEDFSFDSFKNILNGCAKY